MTASTSRSTAPAPARVYYDDDPVRMKVAEQLGAEVHDINGKREKDFHLAVDASCDAARLRKALLSVMPEEHVNSVGIYFDEVAALPDAVTAGFEELREAARLPDPAKGEHATYYTRAFKPYPYGVEYLLGRPVEGTWIGPGLPAQE